jgi:hypothetical protein
MKKILSIIVMMICLGVSGESNAQCADRPIINGFTPQTGFIGSTVTITGANFSAIPANNQVFFGATQATIVSSSFGTLEVRVPEGSTTALISVKNQCNLSAYSKTHFNGVFCPTPLTSTSYQNTSQELSGVYGAYNMLSQDMDNDGKPEVISARNGGGITIAINNSTPGTINFAKYNQGSTGGAAQSIATADFDGDGLKDIVTNKAIMRNTSTGPGNIGLQYVTNSRSVSNYQVSAGDFNNDGKIDIIGDNGGIYIAFNTSTGPGNFSFTNRIYIANVGHRCNGIQIADVDGDGKVDFLGSQGGGNRAVSIRNTTVDGSFTPTFESPEYWSSGGTYPYRSMIADFDKDGKIDFTTCNYNGATNTAIWRNTSTVGNISFAASVNITSPRNNYRIGVGDVDGDGFPDIVTKSLGINVFSVYRNTSSGAGNISFAPRFDYSSSNRAEVSGIVIGDLDGDFVPDIATSGISSNTIRFHRNTGGQNDATPPTAVCRNITVALSPNGTVSITPDMIDNGSGDACGIESLTLSLSDFTCADIGENTVILTATDGAGNQSSCTATVNVQPAAIIVVGQTTVCQGETISASANIGDSYQWKKDGINIPGATTQNYVATTSGAYTVEVTNAGGCSGESIPTSFVVNENPTVDISPAGNAFLCAPNGTTQLTATQSSIYQWIKNGVDIANATQQTYDATTVGTYSVRVIDLFGCSAVSEPTTITADPAEIVVSGTGNYGNVFPNQNYTQTITISNTGTGILDITNLTLIGPDASSFSLAGFSSPGSIPAGATTAVDVIFNAPNITMYSAILSFNSNDCDEDFISIPLNAEITCVAAGFVDLPSDLLVNNDVDTCSAILYYDIETVGNPASVINYILSGATSGNGEGSASGSEFNVGTTTVTINATNPCGNVTESFDVTVVDNVDPNAIVQNVVVQLDASGNGSTTAALVNNGSNDSCGIVSLALSKTAFTCENIGENTVTLMVTDNNDNVSSAKAIVTVEDTIAPVVLTKDITVELDENGEATITPEDIQKESIWIAYLNVFELPGNGGGYFGGEVTDLNSLQTDINEEAGTVTLKPNFSKYVAGDPVWSNGNIGNKIIQASTYVEETALVGQSFAFNGNVISNTLDASYQNYAFVRIFTENFSLLEETRYPLVQGETFSVQYNNTQPGAVYVQYGFTVEGLNGNPANEEALGNILVEAGTVLADACGESFAIDNAAFNCNNIGENTVTLTVIDNNGNISSAMALVTIEDTIAPTIIAQDITVQLNDVDIDENSIANVFDATTLFSTGFEEYSKGETIAWPHNSSWETWSTISTQSTTIDEDITWSASKSMRVDNDDDILLNVGNLISNPTGAKRYAFKSKVYVPAGVSAEFNFQCNFERSCWIAQFGLRGNGEIHLNHDIIEGKSFPNDQWVTVIVIIDGISEKATLLVNDEYVTQFNWSESELFYGINFYNTSGDGTSYYLDDLEFVDITAPNTNQLVNTVSDNCSPLFVYADPASFDCSTVGENTVDLVVLDLSFNSAKDQAVIVVEDSVAPTAITQDITVTLDEFGSATITPKDLDNGSSDNCTFTLSIDVTTFDCTNIGLENTVTLTVTDASGNTDVTTANVTILEHFKETLDLRSLSSFEAFTGTGAVTNSGNFTGNVGTNVGALTGFTGPNFNGNIHFNDALTAQAELDLLKVYIHLNNIFVTHPGTHAPAFGSGETLTPGVYDIGGAGSVAGNLTLDGLGDPNAVFIMKFKGAFTAGAGSNIVLTNGADAANVFWVAQGALSVGANSVIKGTLLAYPGAITLGVNSSIEGRLLSSVGAITVGVGGTAMMPGAMNVPINPMVSYTPAAAVDVLGSIENFSLFTSNGAVANASTSGILGDVGADVGAISGFATSAHIGSFYSADPVTAQAKIDLNNAYTQLMLIPTTVPNHTPAFGSGETLLPGVYSTPGAGSLAGIVTLDGQNNPDAIFIFKFNGAFAAAAQSKVILSNGTRRCNVFWISEGAASIGSFSMIKGTVLAHGGAATMGAGGNLEGRLLSTGGAIGFSTGVVYTVVHDVECDTYTEQKTAVKEAVSSVPDSIEETLVIYPNPSRGVFNIKLAIFNVETEIYLFDTTGKLIARKSISKENNSGNMIAIGNNNLSSGIYLVKIITKNETVTKKVIVEKSH